MAVGIGLHAQLGKDVVHLIFVEQAIHEPVFEGILGQRDLQFVGDPVQGFQVDTACLGHRTGDGIPHRIDQLLHLFAVSVRHFGKYIGLDGALVLAGRGAENLGLDVELVEQPLVERQIERKARPVHPSFGLHVNLVGRRSEVILPLRVGFVIGDDELAALLEIDDRLTQLFEQGRTRHSAVAVHTQVNTLDPRIVLRRLERTQRLHQRKHARRLERREIEAGERIARRGIGQHLRKIELEDRLGVYGHAFLHRTGNAEQDENPKEDYQYRPHDKREDGSQESFDKIHNEVIFCLS